jgi:hypothetical protein
MSSTFPLNQSLYFDFSHDTNIYSIITALGMTQFNQSLPTSGPPANQQAVVSHMTPFGARMVWEIIAAPHPLRSTRPAYGSNATLSDYYETNGTATKYVHVTLSQRTVPLGKSYAECGQREDGWCELETYLNVLGGLLDQADFEYACFGNYASVEYGEISDGRPLQTNGMSKRDLGSRSLAMMV